MVRGVAMVSSDADARREQIVARIDASIDAIRAAHDALKAMLLASQSPNGRADAGAEVADDGGA